MDRREPCPGQSDGVTEPFACELAAQIGTAWPRPLLGGDGQLPKL